MPERDRTEYLRLIEEARREIAEYAEAGEYDIPSELAMRLADALERLITEADTAERWKDTAETLEADYREKLRTAERDLDEAREHAQGLALVCGKLGGQRDEARKALEQIAVFPCEVFPDGPPCWKRKTKRPCRPCIARAALASLLTSSQAEEEALDDVPSSRPDTDSE